MFCVHYTPKGQAINVKRIPWKLVYARSEKDAVDVFNAQYPNDRVLYVMKV